MHPAPTRPLPPPTTPPQQQSCDLAVLNMNSVANSKHLTVLVSPYGVCLRVCASPEEVVFACFHSSFQEPVGAASASGCCSRGSAHTDVHFRQKCTIRPSFSLAHSANPSFLGAKRHTRRKMRTTSASVSALVPSGALGWRCRKSVLTFCQCYNNHQS